jgi:para-nitrobenzyl esterase
MQGQPEAPPPNEDCLYLNVHTPVAPLAAGKAVASAGDLLPVMVWIHGGGMCIGDSSDNWGTGWDFVSEKNVVLVNFNYRLGALGFLVSDATTRGGLPDSLFVGNGGMNGLHDQIVALQWVQREIANFGGDPRRVTIFGESSGGSSVCTLTVSPLAAGLFHQSIVQSGPCIGGWGPNNVTFAKQITQLVLANHSAASLVDLQSDSVDPATIQWPDEVMLDPTIAPYFSAYFFDEGGVMPVYPVELYRKAAVNVENFIIGATRCVRPSVRPSAS